MAFPKIGIKIGQLLPVNNEDKVTRKAVYTFKKIQNMINQMFQPHRSIFESEEDTFKHSVKVLLQLLSS